MRRYTKTIKLTAAMLLMVLTAEWINPLRAYALTSGPSQPEVQSFEPVGTTDMVDMFSGDFVYNVPLIDVEGYPVNISYHGGVNMEQEASWVGLGWNINPGEINRTVRGLPDDFNGEVLSKELHITDENTLRVGVGVGLELAGVGDPWLNVNANLGANVTYDNYKGMSCDFDLGGGLNVYHVVSAGVNIGVGSQSGASVGYSVDLTLRASRDITDDITGQGSFSASFSQGYSTRSGVGDRNISVSVDAKEFKQSKEGVGSSLSASFSDNIPVGIKNFVPVITNSSTMSSIFGRIKVGGELEWCNAYATANGMYSSMHYNNDGTRNAYGYLYAQNAQVNEPNNTGIMDFTRDKDGMFNQSMQFLPPAHMTYDIYSVNGQGTGGVFRPFRNDFGSVYDPSATSNSKSNSFGLEWAVGGFFELGGDYTHSTTDISSGPWHGDYLRSFSKRQSGRKFEEAYFKEAGEMTVVDPQYYADINGLNAISPNSIAGLPHVKAASMDKRDARGNLIYYFTGQEASISGVGSNPNIVNYTSTNGFESGPTPATTNINRIGATPLDRKKDQISEIVQVQKDGRRYVYGLPALNHIQKEATFSVDPATDADMASGLVSYSPGTDDAVGNSKGLDNYYSSTVTPSYAHSYLLSEVLSSDYVDVTGDGISDDDLGSYTKFNYSLKENDYRWKAPYSVGKAQYSPGFLSDQNDDKGMYSCGSREEWMLHSIETRNFLAEFYTSERSDACGSTAAIASVGPYAVAPYNSTLGSPAKSYKLDSIKLYNKHDRFVNGVNAVPVKTVFFSYSYDLCAGIPNTTATGSGKLTLNKIYFKYGSSEKSMMSPYQFTYGYNPNYDLASKDRWGTYKPNNPALTNYEFPFVNQSDVNNDLYASAWSLTAINLPSGGVIQANYESDDYAFVQDKVADEMFSVAGIGNGTNYNSGAELYADKNSPYLYFYFKRKTAMEKPSLSFRDNYLRGEDLLYYNFRVKLLNDKDKYEAIKGYAQIVDVGPCNESDYGYVKVASMSPQGGGATMNPVSYTAINTGRYNLPQVMFPGSAPHSSFGDALAGLGGAFGELVSIFKSPIVHFVKKKAAKSVKLDKSYIRLQSTGLKKKGGGQRVKSLLFYDSWNTLAGGTEQNATYGKKYDYTTKDNTYGVISSGVASYEPLIGGDENPFRKPIPYIVQSASNFPPNDAVGLYQEYPIGESLFPPGSVGYSKVTVTSIHEDVGKSSQGVDIHQFYTAKDFPAQVKTTGIDAPFTHKFQIFWQENSLHARQGFSLIFNNMHGKPKSVEHFVNKNGTLTKISGQEFNYHQSGGTLDNNVKCLVNEYGSMVARDRQLGIESDVTIDSREREELTKNSTLNVNLNVSSLFLLIIPIPWTFVWPGKYRNEFQSVTVTKVSQQYGILDNVVTDNEGAITVVKNEMFDPQTGNVLVTSVNNEYQDKEYSTNIPAYWCYSGMAPAYTNIKYETDISRMQIDTNRMGKISAVDNNLLVGDELLFNYTDSATNTAYQTIVWFMGNKYYPVCPGSSYVGNSKPSCCDGYVLPRFPLNTPGWDTGNVLTNIHVKVIRSGNRNMLTDFIENYSSMSNPVASDGTLKRSYDSVISIKARTYCDSNTMILNRYIANADTINPYAIGERGVYRLLSEYAYQTNRSYSGVSTRYAGLFSANSLFKDLPPFSEGCIQFPYNYIAPYDGDANWHAARTITKWSPFGMEVENKDAVGNYSTAVYRYNEDLPVAVASNARQGEVLADGFEDYKLLHVINNLVGTKYSLFNRYFNSTTPLSASTVYDMLQLVNSGAPSIVSGIAHTGLQSLSIPAGAVSPTNVFSIDLPVNNSDYSSYFSRYNSYFPYGFSNFSPANEYLPFQINENKSYILSYWIRKGTYAGETTTYTLPDSCGVRINGVFFPMVMKSNLIDGWQKIEAVVNVPTGVTDAKLRLPSTFYVDDIRLFPSVSNMKAFVYHPVNEKLMATLDENNFATMYEYDQEGNLVRVKKETEKGIMTVSESRSGNPAQ